MSWGCGQETSSSAANGPVRDDRLVVADGRLVNADSGVMAQIIEDL
jgi:hypothetical protein